jgi:hypothetical protein
MRILAAERGQWPNWLQYESNMTPTGDTRTKSKHGLGGLRRYFHSLLTDETTDVISTPC